MVRVSSALLRLRWGLVALLVPVTATLVLGAVLFQPLDPCGECEIVQRVDAELVHDPQLLVIGNSTARHAVDLGALATGLGVDPARTAVVGLPTTTPSTWYAMLVHRVYARGLHPDRIIVLAPSGAMWVARAMDGADIDIQVALAGSEDPVLSRSAGIDSALDRFRFRADLRLRLWREHTLQAVLGNGGALWALWRDPLAGEFDVDLGDDPEWFRGVEKEGVDLATRVEDTFVPDLVALAQEHGARITFARIPSRVRGRNAFTRTRPDGDPALADWLAAHGSAYHRMDDLHLPDSAYIDRFHLKPQGAVEYTKVLLQAMTGSSP